MIWVGWPRRGGAKLTQEQRQAWERVAKQQFSKPRLGQRGVLEGEQVFVRHGTVLKQVGKELPLWPAPRPVFAPNPVAALSITQGSDGVRITLQVSGPVREDIMVSGQAPCSAGRKKWRRGAYLCLLPAVEGGQCDITAQYVERFGEPAPGTKVFIRTQQQRDGWRDMESDLSEVVPVKAAATEVRMKNEECRMETAETVARPDLWLNGLKRLHKLRELQGLHRAGGAQGNGVPGERRRKGRTMYKGVVPCRYRINSVAIPSGGCPEEGRRRCAACRHGRELEAVREGAGSFDRHHTAVSQCSISK